MGESRDLESPTAMTEVTDDQGDDPIACRACGDVLEEGKAYELAGNRWHIDCFRCHTCGTFLDSDANLLMLGDGSLICNNCTYSCSSCGEKIEDLAILTGDQAFCATCFKCRNCKRKIDNLRYARTSQGIFCMDCHESLMARRRKRTARNAAQRQKPPSVKLDKSLPSLPPTVESSSRLDSGTPSTDPFSETSRSKSDDGRTHSKNDLLQEPHNVTQDTLILPSSTYSSKRQSVASHKSDDGEEFLIPVAFDPTPTERPSPQISASEQGKSAEGRSRDYFEQASVSDSRSPHVPEETHMAFQENRQSETDHFGKRPGDSISSIPPDAAEKITQQSASRKGSYRGSDGDRFKLQDVPKGKGPSSRNEYGDSDAASKPHSEKSGQADSQKSGSSASRSRTRENGSSDLGRSSASPTSTQQQYHPPKRGDSLESKLHQPIHRKGVSSASKSSHSQADSRSSEIGSTASSTGAEHARTGSRTTELAGAKYSPDPATPTAASHARTASGRAPSKDNLTPTRPAHQTSTDGHYHGRNESTNTTQSDTSDANQADALLRYSAADDFSMDEDMARILGAIDGNQSHDSFLRRVSNSVRHGRSISDKAHRLSKDQKTPKSPSSGANVGTEISSPTASSPDNRDELTWFKNELKRERQKVIEKDQKIAELESSLNAAANIKQVNTELREKRSTMVFLDAQKEVTIRELEVLTEHISAEKQSGAPLDLNKMSNAVLRDLAESIRGLKDSFTSQIEESIQKRNELVQELGNLGRMKDKSFQEFEQLSLKNAQLAELNNQLVHQIQELYKANSSSTEGAGRQAPNGLGIYSHQKDKSSTASVDVRDIRRSPNDGSISGTTAAQSEEAEPATVIQGPQVVSIRKAQPRKFNWKKGGQHVAKGVTKGLKGAFSYQRDGQLTETAPYGSAQSQESSVSGASRSHIQDGSRQGFGFFGNQKHKPAPSKGQSNGNSPALAEGPVGLFGSELEHRLDIEKGVIPSVVTRCIEEVELRGMDAEGIYRKSGGSSQVQMVREGFERSQNYDISDPDLDIHAVTSALKQYFRKLPTPLITFPVYDKLLDACGVTPISTRVDVMQRGLQELPRVHRDVLEFLVFHLKRVVDREKENLMTPMNIAVVFAPTILRPESLSREMTDVQKKNEAMQFLVENCQEIFMGIEE